MDSNQATDEAAALNAYNDPYSSLSMRQIHAHYGIHPSTLSRRLRGQKTRSEAHEPRQKLTSEQEEELCAWIEEEHTFSRPPNKDSLIKMAQAIVRANGGGEELQLGHNWPDRFLERHPNIPIKLKGEPMETARLNAPNEATIAAWYDQLARIMIDHHLDPSDLWNFDEHGLAAGEQKAQSVIGSRRIAQGSHNASSTKSKAPGNHNWCTIIECLSGTGKSVDPLLIFQGKQPQTTWIPLNMPEIHIEATKNAWTNNDVGIRWFKHIFLPQSGYRKKLLLLDGHESHISEEFRLFARENDQLLFYLPPHSTHLLQPLDLSYFGPIKRHYRRALARESFITDGRMIGKEKFIELYHEARQTALVRSVVLGGWRKAGINPWNPQVGLEEYRKKNSKRKASPGPTYEPPRITGFPQGPQELDQLIAQRGNGSFTVKRARKALSEKNAEIAHNRRTIESLQAQLDHHKPKPIRRTVPRNQRTTFVDRETAITARERAEKDREVQLGKEAKRAQKGAQSQSYDAHLEERDSSCDLEIVCEKSA